MKKLGNDDNFVSYWIQLGGADETRAAVVGSGAEVWGGTWTFLMYREQTGCALVTHSAVQINCPSTSVKRCSSSDTNKIKALVVLHLFWLF